jgi:hypothetical protein
LDYFQTHFVGHQMKQNWRRPPVEVRGKTLRLKDFVSWMFQVPVCSERAKLALEPIISHCAEFLPLILIRGINYYAINVVKVVNCLDKKRSEVAYYHNPKKTMAIHSYVFLKNKIENVPIFKVPELDGSTVFVTQKFVDVIIANKLTGVSFADPSINRWDYVFGKREPNTVAGVLT